MSLSSLILAFAARLSPSRSLDQCLATLVSDWPSSSHFSGGVHHLNQALWEVNYLCFLQRLSVPVAFGAFASPPGLAPPFAVVAVVRRRRSSIGFTMTLLLFLQWQTTLHTLRRGYVASYVLCVLWYVGIFLFIKPRTRLFS